MLACEPDPLQDGRWQEFGATVVRKRRRGGTRPLVELAALVIVLFSALLLWPHYPGLDSGSAAASAGLRRLVLGPLGAAAPAAAQPRDASRLAVTATLAPREDVAAALVRAGVGEAEAAAVGHTIAARISPTAVEPGTSLELVLGPAGAPGQPRTFVSLRMRSGIDRQVTIERRAGQLVAAAVPIPVDPTPLRIEGAIGGNFTQSALDAGAPPSVVQQYLQALDANSTFATDLRPDDKFDMVIEYKLSASGERRTGNLLMARLERNGTSLVELLKNRSGAFVSSANLSNTAGDAEGTLWPVNGRLTSGFGMRFHPILGYERMHSGVDLAAPWGTPIRAVRSGSVSFAGWNGGHGEYVMIRHLDGLVSGYGHMSHIAVAVGTPVQAGDVIGHVGATGLATGPHLHFELFRDGRAINPLRLAQAQYAGPPRQQELAALRTRFAWFKQLIPGAALRSLQPRQPNAGT